MLISNTVEIKHILCMYMTYDDVTLNKNIQVNVGDIVKVTYNDVLKRKSGIISTGRITDIKYGYENYNIDSESIPVITLDTATEYVSGIITIVAQDITDITIITDIDPISGEEVIVPVVEEEDPVVTDPVVTDPVVEEEDPVVTDPIVTDPVVETTT